MILTTLPTNETPMEQRQSSDNDNYIVFPAFDLPTKRISFGNGSARVTTIAYEIRCYLHYATLLKKILIQASILYPILPSYSHIHFITYGLI